MRRNGEKNRGRGRGWLLVQRVAPLPLGPVPVDGDHVVALVPQLLLHPRRVRLAQHEHDHSVLRVRVSVLLQHLGRREEGGRRRRRRWRKREGVEEEEELL